MKIVTCSQMREEEKNAEISYGISPLILMENASVSIADQVLKMFPDTQNAVIVCGSGNNGGDGYALARHLKNAGMSVSIVTLSPPQTNDSITNYRIAQVLADNVVFYPDNPYLAQELIKKSDMVVDAIFGTGLSREVTGVYAEIIEIINAADKITVSIDIPSGINADNGEIMGVCIDSDLTVALGYAKLGHFLYPGREYCGDVVVGYISLPDEKDSFCELIDDEFVYNIMPKRQASSHKGTYGKVLILGASKGLTGAACLAATGALKSGAGLVSVACPESVNSILENKLTEAMTLALCDENGYISSKAQDFIITKTKASSVLLFGCGIGRCADITQILGKTLTSVTTPVVIDADGLFALAQDVDILKSKTCPVVITPHYMEMSRLCDLDTDEIAKDPVSVAKQFAVKYGVTVVLKGATTVIANEDGSIYINITGNNGMSSGGSGDLLAGITASFIAQGATACDAACIAVYVAGCAGDMAAESVGYHALLASDTADYIAKVLMNFED